MTVLPHIPSVRFSLPTVDGVFAEPLQRQGLVTPFTADSTHGVSDVLNVEHRFCRAIWSFAWSSCTCVMRSCVV